jgi:hypothetical protein
MLHSWLLRGSFLLGSALVVGCVVGQGPNQPHGDSTSSSSSGGDGGGGSGGTGGTGGTGATGGTGGTGGAPFVPGPHLPVPQVVSYGGKVLAKPKVVAITYADDPAMNAEVDKFLPQLAASNYWTQIAAEYGVGAFTVEPPIHRVTTAPPTLDEGTLLDELAQNLTGVNPAWGSPNSNTIYMFVIPDTSTYETCCIDYDGYHYETFIGGTKVPFAIVCQCPGFDGPNVGDEDQLTVVITHELVEAASDPFPSTDPAYAWTDDDHAIWTVFNGGENADMCVFEAGSYTYAPGIDRMVQKSWSNVEALAGRDPCLPASKAPYFNSVPVLTDPVTIDYYGAWDTKGVLIPVGGSKTIDVQLFSDAPTSGEWTVTAYDDSDFFGGPKRLDFAWDKNTGKNGDTLKLTITVLSKDTFLQGEEFILESQLDGESHLWVGVVGH